MTVIATNTSSMRAANASMSANSALTTAMERLSTGKRINSAKDDAAGLAISTSMTSQIRGMTQAVRNANDGISLLQTADGALGEAANILQRVRELAVQSASDTYSPDDRANMQVEVKELQKQLKSITDTKFNGVNLFSGAQDKVVSIQAGFQSADKVAVTIGKLDLSAVMGTVSTGQATKGLGTALVSGDTRVGDLHTVTAEDVAYGAQFKGTGDDQEDATKAMIGTQVTLAIGDQMYEDATAAGSVTGGANVSTISGANTAIDAIDNALKDLNKTRASIGAGQSRLESAVNSLTTNSTNLSDARSRIEDADFSTETTNLAKAQILSQASTAMLAQANQSQQSVLKLLQ
jgi:flagellin